MRWSTNHVDSVLSNEKYIGTSIVNRTTQRLGTAARTNPPTDWVRCDGAFEAIVPRKDFDAAARLRRARRKTFIPRAELLRALEGVLRREGRLTAAIINAAPELPSANTVELRLGSLSSAYEALDYKVPAKWSHHAVDMRLRALSIELFDQLARLLAGLGVDASRIRPGVLGLSNGRTMELRVCRFQSPKPSSRGWRMCFQRGPRAETLVRARMQEDDQHIRDFVVAERRELERLPTLIQETNQAVIEPWLVGDLASVALRLAGGQSAAADC